MAFALLLLGHILGDFVFQSNEMVHKKFRGVWGVLEHSAWVGAFSIVLLIPYAKHWQTWLIFLTLWSSHAFQDELKVLYQKWKGRPSFGAYLFDQLVHLGVLYGLSLYLGQLTPWMTIPSQLLYGAIFFLFPFVVDITLYEWHRQKSPQKDYMRKYILLCSYGVACLGLYMIFLQFTV